MKHFSKLLFVVFFAMGLSKAHSQVTTSFFTNAQLSKVGIGYDFNDRFWSDLRLYSNDLFSELSPELVGNYNYLIRDKYEAYAGLGVVIIDDLNIVFSSGIALRPFEAIRELSINLVRYPLHLFI